MFNIMFINLPNHQPYREDTVLAGLALEQVTAGHGETYTGRPTTKLINTQHNIIKLRTEYQLPITQAKRFIIQAIAQEKKLAVHHPDKSWFIYYDNNYDNNNDNTKTDQRAMSEQPVIIGNITPTLQALDKISISLCDKQNINYLADIILLYLSTAAQHDKSLDLSLSNFGLSHDGTIYYLDDDIYPCNGFIALTDFVAQLLRSETNTGNQNILELGSIIRDTVLHYFSDEHWLTVIAEDIRSVYLPEQNEPLRQSLISSLYKHRKFNYHPKPTAKIVALMADIHSNAPALETALAYLEKNNVNSGLVLGDIVGYGPHPTQCVKLLESDSRLTVIRGNHDHAVVRGHAGNGITSLAGWAIDWTIDQIDDSARCWLSGLPPFIKTEDWLAVHGSPVDKTFFNAYVYPMTQTENLDNLTSRNIPLCFHGHTHIQKVYYREKHQDSTSETPRQSLRETLGALICPGSIGQPRSGKPGVEFAIINLETRELEYHKLSYDIDTTINDMKKHHFPGALIERLQNGQ